MRAQACLPMTLPRFGVKAIGGSAVVGNDQIRSDDDWRRHVTTNVGDMPIDMGVGDITLSVASNCHDVIRGKPGTHVEPFAIEDHGGNELFRRTLDGPDRVPGSRLQTDDALTSGHHQLILAGNISNDGRNIAASLVNSFGVPNSFAGRFFQAENVGISVVVSIDDHQILIQDRITAEAVSAHEMTDGPRPYQFALEIVAGYQNFTGRHGPRVADIWRGYRRSINLQKRDEYMHAVGCWCTGCKAIQAVFGFQERCDHRLPPKFGPRIAIETEKQSITGILETSSDKYLVLPYDGCRVPDSRDCGFPGNVLVRRPVPLDGYIQFAAATVASRSTPAGPIFGL